MLAVLAMLARGSALRGSAPPDPAGAVARALPGRDRKVGAPIEPESWFCDNAACQMHGMVRAVVSWTSKPTILRLQRARIKYR